MNWKLRLQQEETSKNKEIWKKKNSIFTNHDRNVYWRIYMFRYCINFKLGFIIPMGII